ncbi:MAG TPA: PIN domain-containing protein [Thermoplasmata archaeon]|nr:PIN domain-containing protein [Thermoplasmata archaeon]
MSEAFGGAIDAMSKTGGTPRFTLRVVIDTNIIVQDSIAVAKGKPSTTERILSSPFVEVYAPNNITEESNRILRNRSKRGVPLEPALRHAAALLQRVRLVDPQDPSIRKAREAIGERAPEDVPFLAVAIELGTDAIVSRDKVALDPIKMSRRWELRKLVETVVSFESGSLSVVVLGASVKLLVEAMQKVVIGLVTAMLEILAIALGALEKLVAGTLQALAKVPPWGWLAVAAVVVAVGVYAATHPEVGDRISQGIASLIDGVRRVGHALVEIGTALLRGIHDLLVWLWNMSLPVTATAVVVGGVLLARVNALILEATALQARVPL